MTTPLQDALQRTLGAAFRIDRELGGGGMSRVFLTTDLTLDRQVVVKVLSVEMSAGVSADRFRREIQLVAKLQHPHVVPLLSAGDAEGALFYVMPFISGEPLRAQIAREGPMKISDVVRILRETLDALAFAHKHGVIHRDIKPDNILIGAGHAVVADFGVSKALQDSGTSGELTSIGIALGTPAYMAPEQAAADPTTDHRADLYATAVVAYEMITGAPPFSGTPSQLLKAHLADAPTPIKQRRSDVPDALAEVVMRALEKDPDKRPQSAGEMMAVLEAVSTPGGTQAAAAATPSAPMPAAVPRRSKTPLIAAAALVMVAAVAAWFAMRPNVIVSAQSLAITPFSVADGDTALVRLGQNLVSTMSANLDGVGEIRVADAMSVLSHAKAKGALLSVDDAVDIARKLGARSVVHGTLARAGTQMRADLTLYDVNSPSTPTARLSASVPLDSLSALTDSLTWGLLRKIWSKGSAPTPNAVSIATHSPTALREFLEGERLFARGGPIEAAEAYRRAIDADTTFWFAHYQYILARNWLSQSVDTTISARLSRHLDDLPERERLLMNAVGTSATQSEYLLRLDALLARYPDYPAALLARADFLAHWATESGHQVKEAIAPWRRLAELMPSDLEAASHVAWTTLAAGDVAAAGAAAFRYDSLVRSEAHPLGSSRTQAADLMFATSVTTPAQVNAVARESARDSLTRFAYSPTSFMTVSAALPQRPEMMARRDDLLNRYAAPGGGGGVSVLSSPAVMAVAIMHGQVDVLDGAVESVRTNTPSTQRTRVFRQLARWRVASELQGLTVPSPITTELVLATLTDPAAAPAEVVEARWVAGANALVRGDSAALRQQVTALARDTLRSAQIAVRSLRAIGLGRAGNTAAAAESLLVLERYHGENLLDNKVWPALAMDRLLGAQWLAEHQRYAPADSLLRFSEGYLIGPAADAASSVFAATQLQRSRVAEGLGNKEAAIRFATIFLGVYDHAPPEAKPQLDDARARITRLGGTPDSPKTTKVP
ncbi:MAG: serine/threonine-protein kinase [Gemmatimonadetes bacterium]|nr:serine/threonine-protein kinase [Gemmatimonadota bacterium]